MAQPEDELEGGSRRARPRRPGSPIRPAAPTPASPSRPAEPEPIVPPEAPDDEQMSPASEIIDDDDVMAIPAPPAEVFAPRPSASPKKRPPAQAGLEFRRTVIPILLTFGVALPLVGAWWFTRGAESPIRSAGLVLPIVMFVVGAVLLLLAVLNMLQVRGMLGKTRDA